MIVTVLSSCMCRLAAITAVSADMLSVEVFSQQMPDKAWPLRSSYMLRFKRTHLPEMTLAER
jgi:hypothetical protein